MASLMFLQPSAVHAQNYGTFHNFIEKEVGQLGGYKYTKNPTSERRIRKVHQFSIVPGCRTATNEAGYSDCNYNSVRSELYEDVWAKEKYGLGQPIEAWYGWEVFVPESFPRSSQQLGGKYTFNSWHNGQCPHLAIINRGATEDVFVQFSKRAGSDYDCKDTRNLKIANIGQMRGKWTRFEVFVRWSTAEDGYLRVFVNGVEVQNFKGATLIRGLEEKNYFNFGVYLCCTRNINTIKPASIIYANVSRAKTRKKLRWK